MDRAQQELLLLTQPLPCLSIPEARRALRLAHDLGRAVAERRDPLRAGIRGYLMAVVQPAEAAGLMTDGSREHWASADAEIDARVVSYRAGFALARAGG